MLSTIIHLNRRHALTHTTISFMPVHIDHSASASAHSANAASCADKLAWFLEQLHMKLFWQKPGIPLSGKRMRRSSSTGTLRRASRSWENVPLAAEGAPSTPLTCLRQVMVSEGGGKENQPEAVFNDAASRKCQRDSVSHQYSPAGSPVKVLGLSLGDSVHNISRTFSEGEEVYISSCDLSCVRCASPHSKP